MKTLIIAFLLGILTTVVVLTTLANSDYPKMARCMKIYAIANDANDPDFIHAAKEQGFKTVKDMVKSRCKEWVKAGQFDRE